MKTGKSSFEHVYGASFWDRMRRLPNEYEMFNRALADLRSDTSGSPGPTTGQE